MDAIAIASGVFAGYGISGLVYMITILRRESPRGYPGADGSITGRELAVEWLQTIGMIGWCVAFWPGILLARSRDASR